MDRKITGEKTYPTGEHTEITFVCWEDETTGERGFYEKRD